MRSSVVMNWCQFIYMTPVHLLMLSSGVFMQVFPSPIGTWLAALWIMVGYIPALMLAAMIGLALAPVVIFASIFGK